MPELQPHPEPPTRFAIRSIWSGHSLTTGTLIAGDSRMRRTDDEGWQVVWLNDPTVPAELLTPAEGVAEATKSDEEWRREAAAY